MTRPNGGSGTGSSGGSGTGSSGGGGSRPKGHILRAIFEGLVIGAFILAAVFVATAINPKLLAPSVMVVGAGFGIAALALVARRRWVA